MDPEKKWESQDDSPILSSPSDTLLGHSGEAQKSATTVSSQEDAPQELKVASSKKLFYLSLYFVLNLVMTLSNKAVLQRARLPWLLTALHALSTSIGCMVLHYRGVFQTSLLGRREIMILVSFSTLFTLNIAVSNVSLGYVSVPFHQVLRSTTPVATMVIYILVYSRAYGQTTYMSMVPLVTGVGLATYGDYTFTPIGFWMTILGVFLGAIKAVASNRLMTGSLKLPALELLLRMSPLAALQSLLCALATGEASKLRALYDQGESVFTAWFLVLVAINVSIAFFLNFVSFETNKVAGALTVSVCANVKQALTILFGIVLFNVHVTPLHAFGIMVTIAGAAWYSAIDLQNSRRARLATMQSGTKNTSA